MVVESLSLFWIHRSLFAQFDCTSSYSFGYLDVYIDELGSIDAN